MDDLDGLHPRVFGGRYRLLERLGTGGMAVVWRGYDEVLRRRVAVKVVTVERAATPQFTSRLRTEARSAAGLTHPNITSVFDYGEENLADGSVMPYLVMELVEGPTLSACWAAGGGRLPWPDAVDVCAQVAAGLAAAHARGIVHCDITPNNIILSDAGPKILDFGISTLSGAAVEGLDGELVGTAYYIAPERIGGDSVSAAADVYSLGLLLYRSLSGRLPWPPVDEQEALLHHLQTPPAPLPPIDGLPADVEQLCLRCLAKDPQDRPSSTELADALGTWAAIRSVAAVGVSAEPRTTMLAAIGGNGPLTQAGTRLDLGRWTGPVVAARRRPFVAAAVLAVILAAAAAPWLLSASKARVANSGEEPQASTCVVSYAIRSDAKHRLEATLTIESSQERPASRWELAFTSPGDQRISAVTPATVRQQDGRVFLRAARPLGPAHGGLALNVSGTSRTRAAAPTDFALDGQPCRTTSVAPMPTPSDDDDGSSGSNSGSGKGKGKGND